MAASLSKVHRQYVFRETALAIVIAMAFSLGFALMASHGKDAMPLWGARGMAVDFIPQTFMLLFMTAVAVTLITRKRLRSGAVPPLPVEHAGPLGRMPRQVFVRAFLIALIGAIVLTPLYAGGHHTLGILSLSAPVFVAKKTIYGATLALVAAPFIIRGALAWSVREAPAGG